MLPFDWGGLVPFLVHPMKVTIIEALRWIGQPLSATDIRKTLDGQFTVQFISYHMGALAKVGAIVEVRHRRVRGSIERFYFFS